MRWKKTTLRASITLRCPDAHRRLHFLSRSARNKFLFLAEIAKPGKTQTALYCIVAQDILHNWQKKTAERRKLYQKFLYRADKNAVLRELPRLHEEAFEKID